MESLGKWIAGHDDVLPAVAGVMAAVLVWRAYKFGCATGAYRAPGDDAARLASEALGG